MKRFVIIAGETSGDQYGAKLMNTLQELNKGHAEFWGVGGADMQSAGLHQFENILNMSVMGFSEAIKKIPKMSSLSNRISQFIIETRPNSVVLIDYPGFNLNLAKKIKKISPHTKIDFFISPQVWAWNEQRVSIIKKNIDNMIVIFPFEKKFYKKYGVNARYVGHPFLDTWRPSSKRKLRKKLNLFMDKKIIGIFPGSRKQELEKHLPIYIEVAKKLKKDKNIECVIGLAPGFCIKKIKNQYNLSNIKIIDEHQLNLLECSDLAIVTSGTISLQATFMNTPCVVAYKMSTVSGLISKLLIKVKYISMTNIVAGKQIIPELIQKDVTTNNLIDNVNKIINDKSYEKWIKNEMNLIKNDFIKKSDAIINAAKIIDN